MTEEEYYAEQIMNQFSMTFFDEETPESFQLLLSAKMIGMCAAKAAKIGGPKALIESLRDFVALIEHKALH